jgi:hypothetical protein
MKTRHLAVAMLMALVYLGSFGSARAFTPQPGTADDPLITVSFFNQAIQPFVARLAVVEALTSHVAGLEQRIARLEAQVVALEARLAQQPPVTPPVTPPPVQPVIVHGFINGSVVNIRSGPGTTFSIVTTLPLNTRVEVLERGKDWHRVRLQDGRTGFVSAPLLRIP